jgi:hypothetical protein
MLSITEGTLMGIVACFRVVSTSLGLNGEVLFAGLKEDQLAGCQLWRSQYGTPPVVKD